MKKIFLLILTISTISSSFGKGFKNISCTAKGEEISDSLEGTYLITMKKKKLLAKYRHDSSDAFTNTNDVRRHFLSKEEMKEYREGQLLNIFAKLLKIKTAHIKSVEFFGVDKKILPNSKKNEEYEFVIWRLRNQAGAVLGELVLPKWNIIPCR